MSDQESKIFDVTGTFLDRNPDYRVVLVAPGGLNHEVVVGRDPLNEEEMGLGLVEQLLVAASDRQQFRPRVLPPHNIFAIESKRSASAGSRSFLDKMRAGISGIFNRLAYIK